ncbi:hypothetical protein Z945_2736 [Sulfitobacter noctilucae]|uniref:hypothetical protein n=1 Tax=Sulfitobacter noctilucae TaxID=1342302 RepID=UPI00056926F5|nr:hypothetical protein [Sulfitobacter noctilucae]KIN61743.1 hypothetical protein Z945_2736 [Sulfitobacter noctilucae]
MARLFLIVIAIVIMLVMVAVIYSVVRSMAQSAQDGLRTMTGSGEGTQMAPSGIQKTAYIALIIVLFGTAAGWLGGL